MSTKILKKHSGDHALERTTAKVVKQMAQTNKQHRQAGKSHQPTWQQAAKSAKGKI